MLACNQHRCLEASRHSWGSPPTPSPHPTLGPPQFLRRSLLLDLCAQVPMASHSLSLHLVKASSPFMPQLQSHFLKKASPDPRQGEGPLLSAPLLIFCSSLPMCLHTYL